MKIKSLVLDGTKNMFVLSELQKKYPVIGNEIDLRCIVATNELRTHLAVFIDDGDSVAVMKKKLKTSFGFVFTNFAVGDFIYNTKTCTLESRV